MQRRQYLALAGASMTVLAGCSEDEGGGDNSTNGTDAAETEELAETAEPTATATAEPPTDETTMAATEAEPETETMVAETETETETMMETETQASTEMEGETQAATSAATQGGFSETFSGSGKSTVEGLELAPGPITAAFTVDSEAYHTFELVPLEGGSLDDVRLVNGLFSGEGRQVATVAASGEHNLNVDTEAEWELSIEQPTNPQTESLPVDESGSGYDYVGPFAFDGETAFQGTHDGKTNFVVRPVPVDSSTVEVVVFNETGQFDGETIKRVDGPAYLNVMADGEWSVSTG
jgi:hypothetical protein